MEEEERRRLEQARRDLLHAGGSAFGDEPRASFAAESLIRAISRLL